MWCIWEGQLPKVSHPGAHNCAECDVDDVDAVDAQALSRSIRVPNYFHFQPNTPDTPERHPHYAICMTTSINSESIINNTVGSIDLIAVASDT